MRTVVSPVPPVYRYVLAVKGCAPHGVLAAKAVSPLTAALRTDPEEVGNPAYFLE